MTAGVVEEPGTAVVPAKPQPQEPKIAAFKKLPPIVRKELLAALPSADRLAIEHDWKLWARPKQLPPPGQWEVWVALAGRSFGKALALDTSLPTPTGWTTMGDVKVGDTLFDERGQPCTVTFATEIQYDRMCYAVVFDDGTRIVADAEHRWLTCAHGDLAVRTTQYIASTISLNHTIQIDHSLAGHACRHVQIKAVEPVVSVPVRCITVDSPSHLFLCSRAMIPTHNTRLGAEFCHQKADDMPGSRGALIGATSDDVRYTMIEGVSGILATQKPHNPVRYWPAKRLLKWKNGTQARTFTGEEPNRLRGPQHHWGWLDEWATFKYPKEAWDQFMLGKRLGTLAQACVTTTPKPFLELVKLITNAVSCWDLRGADPGDPILERLIATVVTVGTSQENKGNVSDAWYERTIKAYEGTRLYDQEVLGKILTDVDGALWKMATIEASRLMPNPETGALPKLPEMKRTVVAVDPAVTSGKHSNETGIMVCSSAGLGTEKHGYLREDLSGRYTPLQWATKAIAAYHEHKADRIIAEANNGGDLVKTNIQQVDGNVPVKLVHASKGKTARAEPVAAKSEQGRIHHVGVFAMLESQLTTYTPDSGLESPDRMDAYVWGFTDLLLGKQGAFVV